MVCGARLSGSGSNRVSFGNKWLVPASENLFANASALIVPASSCQVYGVPTPRMLLRLADRGGYATCAAGLPTSVVQGLGNPLAPSASVVDITHRVPFCYPSASPLPSGTAVPSPSPSMTRSFPGSVIDRCVGVPTPPPHCYAQHTQCVLTWSCSTLCSTALPVWLTLVWFPHEQVSPGVPDQRHRAAVLRRWR